jgi:hypothetical protein
MAHTVFTVGGRNGADYHTRNLSFWVLQGEGYGGRNQYPTPIALKSMLTTDAAIPCGECDRRPKPRDTDY